MDELQSQQLGYFDPFCARDWGNMCDGNNNLLIFIKAC